MNTDKNLFMYDLAFVAIMKNEAPYVKEWLDYHLLAGVDHFYIYDNESPDNLKEVLQPYIDTGLVTYTFLPGLGMQMEAYNEAIENFKFHCRYMGFIDTDEFVFPRSGLSIKEVIDNFLLNDERFGGVAIPWVHFGSNGQKVADLTRPVLERFTRRRAIPEKTTVKSILNPRKVDYMWSPHFGIYLANTLEYGQQAIDQFVNPPFGLANVISINHYSLKSLEEFVKRKSSSNASCTRYPENTEERFKNNDTELNEVFDDKIIKYRDACKNVLISQRGGVADIFQIFAEMKRVNYTKLLAALASNLLVGFNEHDAKKYFDNPVKRMEYFKALAKFFDTASKSFLEGKLETFLTCLELGNFLKGAFVDEESGRLFEKFSLCGILKSLYVTPSPTALLLLVKEMPKILSLPYPEVEKIRSILIEKLIEVRISMHNYIDHQSKLPAWADILDIDYKLKMLKVFDNYRHNKT